MGQRTLGAILRSLMNMPGLDQRVGALSQINEIVLFGFRQSGDPGGILTDGPERVADGQMRNALRICLGQLGQLAGEPHVGLRHARTHHAVGFKPGQPLAMRHALFGLGQ